MGLTMTEQFIGGTVQWCSRCTVKTSPEWAQDQQDLSSHCSFADHWKILQVSSPKSQLNRKIWPPPSQIALYLWPVRLDPVQCLILMILIFLQRLQNSSKFPSTLKVYVVVNSVNHSMMDGNSLEFTVHSRVHSRGHSSLWVLHRAFSMFWRPLKTLLTSFCRYANKWKTDDIIGVGDCFHFLRKQTRFTATGACKSDWWQNWRPKVYRVSSRLLYNVLYTIWFTSLEFYQTS